MYCHVQETGLRSLELCETANYPARNSHHRMGILWLSRDGTGQQQHFARLWCLYGAQLVARVYKEKEKFSRHHTISSSLRHYYEA